ncbi:MAG: hypothetical protein Q8R92_17225 [Deltaproteobacteria bacterium]|nr:hypothetical protein [Deltaproteobacteria bacterium]
MFAAIAAALALPPAEQGEAISGITPYRSRGKGRGTVERNYLRPVNSQPAFQGKRECARRVRQAAA